MEKTFHLKVKKFHLSSNRVAGLPKNHFVNVELLKLTKNLGVNIISALIVQETIDVDKHLEDELDIAKGDKEVNVIERSQAL